MTKALEDQFTVTVQIGPGLLGQALSSGPNTRDKATKTEANYRRTPTHDESQPESEAECGECFHFHRIDKQEDSPGYCDLVSGLIDEDYVCDWYRKAVVNGK